jgi:hypothetical protein
MGLIRQPQATRRPLAGQEQNIVMRPTTLLASAVLIGLAAVQLAEGAPTFSGNENTFLRPVVHRKGENPVIRSGIRTGRSGLLNSHQQTSRRLARSGDRTSSDSTGGPESQREFGAVVPGAEQGPIVRQFRRIKTPQRKTRNNSVDTWMMNNDTGVMFHCGTNCDNSDLYYCPFCRPEDSGDYRRTPYHRLAFGAHPYQSHQAVISSHSPVPAGPGHVTQEPDLQLTATIPGQQRGKDLVPEVDLKTSVESGSAEAQEEDRSYDEEISTNV